MRTLTVRLSEALVASTQPIRAHASVEPEFLGARLMQLRRRIGRAPQHRAAFVVFGPLNGSPMHAEYYVTAVIERRDNRPHSRRLSSRSRWHLLAAGHARPDELAAIAPGLGCCRQPYFDHCLGLHRRQRLLHAGFDFAHHRLPIGLTSNEQRALLSSGVSSPYPCDFHRRALPRPSRGWSSGRHSFVSTAFPGCSPTQRPNVSHPCIHSQSGAVVTTLSAARFITGGDHYHAPAENRLAPRPARICCSTSTTPSTGGHGDRRRSPKPNAPASRSCSRSAMRPATGATSWRTKASRTSRPRG